MMSSEKINTQENSPIHRSLELAKELENIEDEDQLKKRLPALDSIEGDLGVKFTSDASQIYKEMNADNCLVRVECLSRVLETVEEGSSLSISDANESHFANAVLPIPEGIKIAFSEGQAPGPFRVAIGFGKTIIGFKTENVTVEEIDFSESDIRDPIERKHLCRHVVGNLRKEDIKYLVMRIPRSLLADQYLMGNEKTNNTPFIFRGLRI